MRLAEVTRDVAEQLNDVSERYQVPQRLQMARETARRGACLRQRLSRSAARLSRGDGESAPSAAAGVILAAAIVGGVLWYIFGSERAEEQQRTRRCARARLQKRKAYQVRAPHA